MVFITVIESKVEHKGLAEAIHDGSLCTWIAKRVNLQYTEWYCFYFPDPSKTRNLEKQIIKGTSILRKSASASKKRVPRGKEVAGTRICKTEPCSFLPVSVFQYLQSLGPSNIQVMLQKQDVFQYVSCKQTPGWKALLF